MVRGSVRPRGAGGDPGAVRARALLLISGALLPLRCRAGRPPPHLTAPHAAARRAKTGWNPKMLKTGGKLKPVETVARLRCWPRAGAANAESRVRDNGTREPPPFFARRGPTRPPSGTRTLFQSARPRVVLWGRTVDGSAQKETSQSLTHSLVTQGVTGHVADTASVSAQQPTRTRPAVLRAWHTMEAFAFWNANVRAGVVARAARAIADPGPLRNGSVFRLRCAVARHAATPAATTTARKPDVGSRRRMGRHGPEHRQWKNAAATAQDLG